MFKHPLLFLAILSHQVIFASLTFEHVATIDNLGSKYAMINSVGCHPLQPIFCTTHTQNNKVAVYEIDDNGLPKSLQTLKNPKSCLNGPQHAVFSHDGTRLIVSNWNSETLTFYLQDDSGFSPIPTIIFPAPVELKGYKPHGISASTCGNYLAIAYGATALHNRAIALFRLGDDGLQCTLVDAIYVKSALPGIPKGIAFSPDDRCLLVTFCDIDSLYIYDIDTDQDRILPQPKQVVCGTNTGLRRPEDVKISKDGRICAVSNSEENTVTFYHFDAAANLIAESNPCYIMKRPEHDVSFPHGLDFSADGQYFLVTTFGQVSVTQHGDIKWRQKTPPKQSKTHIFRISYLPR